MTRHARLQPDWPVGTEWGTHHCVASHVELLAHQGRAIITF